MPEKKINLLPTEPGRGASCDCPVCGVEYEVADTASCAHLLCDWCFTMDYYAGEKRGVWPTEAGNEVLIRFDAAMRTIAHLLDYAEWPSDEVHETVTDSVPVHLRIFLSESWSQLLDARIAGAPGYIGTHHLFTDRMAGDAWNVHWAHDAAKAAAPVITAFEEELAILEPLVEKAKRTVISE